MNKNIIQTGAVLGFLTVAIGAFGAHGLKPTLLSQGTVETFHTAVRYQAIHTFAVLLVGVLFAGLDAKKLKIAFGSFLIGIVFFSGSLYILSITGIKVLGAITPIGGVCLLVGWVFLFLATNKKREAI